MTLLADGLITTTRSLKHWIWDTHARIVLGAAISLGLGWLTIRGLDWGLVVDQFQEFPIGWALASLALMVLANFVKAYRWQRLFVRHKMPLMQLFLVQNVGIGLNNLVPVRVVSEGVQYAMLTIRYGVKGGVAIAALAAERILDLIVTATILMAGLTLIPGKGDFLPYVVGAFVVAILSLLALPTLVWLSKRSYLGRFAVVITIATFLLDLSKSKGALASSILLTLLYWLLVGLSAWVLAYGMDLGISPFIATLTILGTVYFTTSLPALPAAVGTFEFAIVYVLRVFDVSQDMAFSYGVVIHAILFLPPIVVVMAALSNLGLGTLRKHPAGQSQELDPLPVGYQKGLTR